MRGMLAGRGDSQPDPPRAQREPWLLHLQMLTWRRQLLPLSEPQVFHVLIGINTESLPCLGMRFKYNVKSEAQFLAYGMCSANRSQSSLASQ